MYLDYVFQRMAYPHLYELSLANCGVCGHIFIDFILRHRHTLRRLSLHNMISFKSQHSGDLRLWPEIFSNIARRLPNLHHVRIRGFFYDWAY
jgi:hypothetical protein